RKPRPSTITCNPLHAPGPPPATPRPAEDEPSTCFASANDATPLVRYPAPLNTSISLERWLSSALTTKILAAILSPPTRIRCRVAKNTYKNDAARCALVGTAFIIG